MDKRIEQLEEWRVLHGLTKVDMADLIGTTKSQNYTNWLGRSSLPKEFYGAADLILTSEGPDQAASRVAQYRLASAVTSEVSGMGEMIDTLDEAQLESLLADVIPTLPPRIRVALAQVALSGLEKDF